MIEKEGREMLLQWAAAKKVKRGGERKGRENHDVHNTCYVVYAYRSLYVFVYICVYTFVYAAVRRSCFTADPAATSPAVCSLRNPMHSTNPCPGQ